MFKNAWVSKNWKKEPVGTPVFLSNSNATFVKNAGFHRAKKGTNWNPRVFDDFVNKIFKNIMVLKALKKEPVETPCFLDTSTTKCSKTGVF